jgi:hypothetical protein
MFIAKIDNGNITVGDYRELFPDTSFPVTGPNDDFYAENGCAKVSTFKQCNQDTEMLIGCNPYLENGIVYTVQITGKPEPVESVVIMDSSSTFTMSMGTGM